MSSGLQVALAGGGLIGLGVAVLAARLLPAHPDLRDTISRLAAPAPAAGRGATGAPPGASPEGAGGPAVVVGRERLGGWASGWLPRSWSRAAAADLAVLRISPARQLGEKLLFAGVGLVAVPLLSGLFVLVGLPVPVTVPVVGTLTLAAVLFVLPDLNVRDEARKARAEFTRGLTAYLDLVALERVAGSGTRQAMEVAADVGDSWVFRRIADELARSRWSGQPPWDALHTLADQLALPDLAELADIMRLSGHEGAQVWDHLRARSTGLRSTLLHTDLTAANETGERLSFPMSLLGVIFLALLVAPALLRLLGTT